MFENGNVVEILGNCCSLPCLGFAACSLCVLHERPRLQCGRCHKAGKASRFKSPRKRVEQKATHTGARRSPGWSSSSSSSGNELSPAGARDHARFLVNDRRPAEDVVSSDKASSNSRGSSNFKSGSSGKTGGNSRHNSGRHSER